MGGLAPSAKISPHLVLNFSSSHLTDSLLLTPSRFCSLRLFLHSSASHCFSLSTSIPLTLLMLTQVPEHLASVLCGVKSHTTACGSSPPFSEVPYIHFVPLVLQGENGSCWRGPGSKRGGRCSQLVELGFQSLFLMVAFFTLLNANYFKKKWLF